MTHERQPRFRPQRRRARVGAPGAVYLADAGGNAGEALRQAIADALADLCEAERRTRRAERLNLEGYVQGRVEEPALVHSRAG